MMKGRPLLKSIQISTIKPKLQKYPVEALTCSILLGLLITEFVDVFKGSQRKSWGYGDFWINYSSGYVRRGLSGEILLFLQNLGITQTYAVVAVICFIAITMNFILSILIILLNLESKFTRFYILVNSTFVLSIISLPSTFLRKDHFIILGILVHSFATTLILKGKISAATYKKLMWVLIIYTLLIGQFHEIQALFIPIHSALFLLSSRTFEYTKLLKMKVLVCWALVCITTLGLSSLFHGSTSQANQILKSIPIGENLEPGAIIALGWSAKEGFALSERMLTNQGTLFAFGCILIIGPIAIVTLLLHKSKKSDVINFLSPLSFLPILFFLGWDWGRWINMITFSVLALIPIIKSKSPEQIKFKSLPISLVLLVLMFSLSWSNPECCTRAPEEAVLPLLNVIHLLGITVTP